MSDSRSDPRTFAGRSAAVIRPMESWRGTTTSTRRAEPITWAFVTIWPSLLTITPDPRLDRFWTMSGVEAAASMLRVMIWTTARSARAAISCTALLIEVSDVESDLEEDADGVGAGVVVRAWPGCAAAAEVMRPKKREAASASQMRKWDIACGGQYVQTTGREKTRVARPSSAKAWRVGRSMPPPARVASCSARSIPLRPAAWTSAPGRPP
jgi:hypothetical protein